MFVRKFIRRRANGTVDTYLVLARTYRQGKKIYQQELCRLGKLDELQASGQLDRLIRSLAQFSQQRWIMVDNVGSEPDKLE